MFRLLVLVLALWLCVAEPEPGTKPGPETELKPEPELKPELKPEPGSAVTVQGAPGLGQPCGARKGGSAGRCASGLECVKKDRKSGVCACKSSYEVCGTDGLTYVTSCHLREASARAESVIQVRHKGRCETAPSIVTAPGEVWNVTGSQVFLSCEATGVPTPVVTWKKISQDENKTLLLPGDQDNLAIQTRGGPEKHQVTGWVLISPLTEQDAGLYECYASNVRGEASAVGNIHVVQTLSDIPTKHVVQDGEL